MHRRDGKLIVSATDLVGFLECRHLTRLERAATADLISKPNREDPEVELLQRRGAQHEQRYIDQLESDGRDVIRLAADWERPYEERAAETAALMRSGTDVIYQATVFDGRWVGHPDFLLRVDGLPPSASRFRRSGIDETDSEAGGDRETGGGTGHGSGLGHDWHYEVADTKLAHSAKASALIQICCYVDQIQGIQGVAPEKVKVVTGGATIGIHAFRTAEMIAFYRHAKRRFEEAIHEQISGAAVWPIPRDLSYPDPVDHCAVCRWFPDYCRRQWRTDDALPLVAGISRAQREVLTGYDVLTRGALSSLTQPFALDLKRGQDESMWRVREQARVQVASDDRDKPAFELLEPEKDSAGAWVADRGLSALPPPSDGDLFFDIEGDPFAFWEGLEYLFGIWEHPDSLWQDGYRAFWAMNRDEEKLAFEQVVDLFMARWKQFPDMHIYHYAPYEPTALKRLAARHGTREDEIDQLLRNDVLVDLYRVVRQGLRVGTERYSIKNLEILYGYKREIELRDANSSIVEFEKVLELGDPDGALKEQIRLYNRDDCISTERLRDWLEQRRIQAAAEFGTLPRPAGPTPEAAAVIRPQDVAVHALKERLTAGLPAESARTAEQQASWLLAQLLDWHRRERKASYWRFFELMTLSPAELLEEKEPISGLVYEGVVGQNKAHNNIHRYSFPAQEHDVGDNGTLHDPAKPAFDGSRVGPHRIDEVNLTLDISRPPDWAGVHPLAVVPDNTFFTEAQEKALMRIGGWVAEHGIDSELPEYRAARDLLLRRPPRVGQGERERLVHTAEGETGKDAACRLALLLDRTTLPIQGPPGSGKTYTGARMILEIVRNHGKVGITSNSHKVIGNLLRAVCDAAKEAREPIRVMQKGDADEVISHDFIDVKRAASNAEVDKALADDVVDVVGGTPWLWARHEIEGRFETLFVDEAGQVALANVVSISGCARNVVLLGDPQQLDQPTQGVHPDGAGTSALAYLLDSAEVIEPERGVFLERTWRMHPSITAYTSRIFYRGELSALPELGRQQVLGDGDFSGAGLRWVPVNHAGNTDASPQEVDEVERIWKLLVGREWTNERSAVWPIGSDGIVIVSPFNAHRKLIQERLPEARVGTVDKFQGQQAPVSIYTMATSRPEDAPRGVGFLYSLNRLNVATSRARALAIVVASPALLDVCVKTPDQLRMANALVAFVEEAVSIS